MDLRTNLQLYRKKAGYKTAKDFSKVLGIPYNTYAGYETLHREPKLKTLIKIADLLNVSTDELLGRENNISYGNEEKILNLRNLLMLEVSKQENQWGKENLAPHEWLGLIVEEIGEMSEAVNETYLSNATKKSRGGVKNIRSEALQAAALIVRFLESLEEK